MPGVPTVVMGRSDKVAFGFTYGFAGMPWLLKLLLRADRLLSSVFLVSFAFVGCFVSYFSILH